MIYERANTRLLIKGGYDIRDNGRRTDVVLDNLILL